MITEIRKRDGRIEPFDASKIANAITKAMVEEYEKIISETQKPNNVLSIEDLQRMNGQPVWIEDIHEWAIVSVDENGYYEGIPFAQGHCFNWNIKDRNLKCYRKPPVSNTQEDN